MDRLINFLFVYLLVGLFVFLSPAETQVMLLAGFGLAFLLSWLSFFLNWLSLDGARAAIPVGTAILGFGGFHLAWLVLLFFVSGSLLAHLPWHTHDRSRRERAPRRNGIQVWSNSFWLVLTLILFYYNGQLIWLGAALTALAAATSDTWATELGSEHFDVPTFSPVNLKRVPAGTDGGISLPGTAAACGGSLLIAGTGAVFFSLKLDLFFIIFLAGFLGSIFDSWLGFTLQGRDPVRFSLFGRSLKISMDNNMVNWTSSGLASLTALILIGILL